MQLARGLRLMAAVLGLALAATGPAAAQDRGLIVFAAASLKNALDDVAASYAKDRGRPLPKISYAASNALAKQIEQGSPADLFVSADLDWMDYLQSKGQVRPGSRVTLLGNRLALIASKDTYASLSVVPGFDLAGALKGGRLAMANIEAVPAGKYGKAALEKLNAWPPLKDRLAQADNVRAALLLVARGEAPFGIVYQTDAAADPSVKIVGLFPPDSHPPILYPAAIVKDSTNPDAAGFLDYLRGAAARAAFEKQGFTFVNQAAS